MITISIIKLVLSGDNFIIPEKDNIISSFDSYYIPNTSRFLPSGKEHRLNYGYAEFNRSLDIREEEEYLLAKLQFLENNIEKLTKYGLQEITLYLTYQYKNQFNYEFSSVIIRKLSKLSIKLCISAYEGENSLD